MTAEEHTYRIMLDCPPGPIRPDVLLPGVLEGTGLKMDDFEELGRFFGCWSWGLKPGKDNTYVVARETIKQRIVALYKDGRIRYGEW